MTNESKFFKGTREPFMYKGRTRDAELNTLSLHLKGQPDEKGWRKIFAEKGKPTITFNGRIISRWAIEDYHRLTDLDPGIADEILPIYDLSPDDIPPPDFLK